MRKTICLLLALGLLLSLTGCGGAEPAPTPEPTPEPTAAADMEWGFFREGTAYEGRYTGALLHGRPEGQGVFTGADAAGELFSWEGGWSEGSPAGDGTMALEGCTAVCENVPTVGVYTGRGRGGVPEGEGTFTAADMDGVTFTYTGHWAAGAMDGQGTLCWASENRYVRSGTFTAGSFTPTWLEALETIGTYAPRFTLSEAQRSFIGEHPELWERETHQNYLKSEYRKTYNKSLLLRKCFEKPELIEEPCWIGMTSLRVLRAYTVRLGEHGFTCITAADGSYAYPVRLILPDMVEGLRRGQRFHAYAMPIAFGEYTTVNGADQTCLVLLAGDVHISQ